MKNYLVYEEWYNDMDSGRDFHLFDSFDKAKEFFNKTTKTSIIELDYNLDDDNIVVDSFDTLYEIYEDGYYLCNHYTAFIKELELI